MIPSDMTFQRRIIAFAHSTENPQAFCDALLPQSWVVEAGCEPPSCHDPALLLGREADPASGMALSVSSTAALSRGLGPDLTDRLADLGAPLGPLAGLALHELIVNAALHGNLRVSSGAASTWPDIADRQAAIEAALANPAYARLCVSVALGWGGGAVRAVIADEGAGYDAEAVICPRRAAGRGLRIARMAGRVTVARGGRQTTLVMDRQPAAGRPGAGGMVP